jgi:hypothetical protein
MAMFSFTTLFFPLVWSVASLAVKETLVQPVVPAGHPRDIRTSHVKCLEFPPNKVKVEMPYPGHLNLTTDTLRREPDVGESGNAN